MQLPEQLDPNEIRVTIWNGCIETPNFGPQVPGNVKLRFVEYDTDGINDDVPDSDHEGKECIVRQFRNEAGPERSLLGLCRELYGRIATVDNGYCTVCHSHRASKSSTLMEPCENPACPTHGWEEILKGG